MAKIVVPSIRRTYGKLIKQVIADLGKPVVVYLPPLETDCPNCIYDFVNSKSSGKFDASFTVPTTIYGTVISPLSFTRGRCPVCTGGGRITSADTRSIKALVKWNPDGADDKEILPVGREGKPAVRIKVLRTKFDILTAADYFMVDGVRCELMQPPTIRGLGTQEEMVVAYLLATEVGSDVKR